MTETLANVLDETLDDLRAEADPRRAVIAAYARLERALATQGFARRPSETPEELLSRVLGRLEVSDESIRRLTDLFERAKFSQHDVDSAMKDEAIAALQQVRDELRAAEERRAELAPRPSGRRRGRREAQPEGRGQGPRPADAGARRRGGLGPREARPRRARVRARARRSRPRGRARGAPPRVSARRRRSNPARAVARGVRSASPPTLLRLEHACALGVARSFDLHFRVRPRLARDRSAAARAPPRDLARPDSEAARRALGETTWDLVRADRTPPDDRLAPGIAVPALREVVTSLERL